MPGVSAHDFRLPEGTALRFERSAPELAGMLPSYAVLDSDLSVVGPVVSWMLPSWARIWIRLTAGPISISIGNRRYDPVGAAVMYGVTSRAIPVHPQGGVTVAIDVSPLGWARFVSAHAEAVRDRVLPLDEMLTPELVRDLTTALHASDHDQSVKGIVDEVFLRHLPPPNPHEPIVERIIDAFASPDVHDLSTATERIAINPAALQRMCRRYFGFSPKLLMMRARFLRVLVGMLTAEEPIDHSLVPPGYHNVPHFLRDANRFLGMTPRRFVAMDIPYLRAGLRARQLVMATATPSLDKAVRCCASEKRR